MAINFSKEQQLAIDSRGQNIIVSAGAGSGKTAVLTERIRKLLRSGIKVNELLVLTFTNAAAAEMKERIVKAMSKDELLNNRTSEVDSAYITTFDSFSLSVVKKYHDRLNLTKNIGVIDGSILNVQKRKIINRIFEEFYLKKDVRFDNLIANMTPKDDENIKKDLLKLAGKIDQRSDRIEFLNTINVNYYSEEKFMSFYNEYQQIIFDKIQQIKYNTNKIKEIVDVEIFKKYYNKFSLLFSCKDYDDVYNYLTSKQASSPKLESAAKQLHSINMSIVEDLKKICIYPNKEFIKKSFNDSYQYISIVVDILKQYYKEIDLYKFEHNSFEFIDISKMAISLVKDNKDIQEELKRSFKEILVDEYQDTNDLQEEFISYISFNNVYMVGDIKQSIYGFRNANPLIFKEKYDKYKEGNGGMKIDLNQNFRSNRLVLYYINQIFNRIMDDNIGQAKFKEEHQMRFGLSAYDKGTNENKIHLLTYLLDEQTKKLYKEKDVEMFIVLNDILNKIENKEMVYDKESGEFRACQFKDFAILAADSKMFEEISQLLSYNHIPNLIFKNVEVNKGSILLIIKNIFKIISLDYKKEYNQEFLKCFYAIGRSFVYKYSDEELFDMVTTKQYQNSLLYKDISQFSQLVDTMSLHDLLDLFIEKTQMINKLIEIGDVEDNLIRIEYILKVIESIDKLNMDIFELIDCLEDILENEEKMEFPSAGINENKVKIMTIHKSKGLEFPIVYFIGNEKQFNMSEFKERFIYDDHYGIIAPFYIDGIGNTLTKILLKQRNNKAIISEKIRLLYVALTRAREQMIIISKGRDIEENCDDIVSNNIREKYNSFSSIYSSINFVFSDCNKEINVEDLQINDNHLKSLKKDYKSFILPSLLKIEHRKVSINSIEVEKEKASKETNDLFDEKAIKSMEYGTYIHELFESINYLNPDLSNLSDKEKQMVINFLNQPILNNIEKGKIYKEFEFISRQDNQSIHGIIDLMIEYDNYIDIIDYKLSHTDDHDYEVQLNRYKNYIQQKTNKKVNIYLYSILKNHIVKVEEK